MTDPATPAKQTDAPGVDLSKVSAALVNAALTEVGKNPGRRATLADRVRLLQEYELAQHPNDGALAAAEKGLGDCDKCGGVSQLSRAVCPFCGTAEEQPEARPNARLVAVAPKAKAEVGKITPANKKKFEQCVERVRGLMADLMADTTVSQWRIGSELRAVVDKGIWKYRVDDAGKPLYESFKAFCSAELNMGDQHARDLIKVAEKFSEQEVREIGATKCKLLARLPDELRHLLLEKATDPATSTRDLQQEAQVINPTLVRPGGRKPRSSSVPSQAKPTRVLHPSEITAVFASKTHALSFERDGSTFIARLPLENAVVASVSIMLDGDEITGSLSFEREETEAAQ